MDVAVAWLIEGEVPGSMRAATWEEAVRAANRMSPILLQAGDANQRVQGRRPGPLQAT